MRRILFVLFSIATTVGAAVGQTVVDKHGHRVGELRTNPYGGGFDIYGPRGERLGYGRVSPYDERTIELFDTNGRRRLDLRTPKSERRK